MSVITLGYLTDAPAGLPWMGDETPACSETSNAVIFELAGDRHNPRKLERMAKGICATCPYLLKCREWSLDNDERWGIWGGLNRYERGREIRRREFEALS